MMTRKLRILAVIVAGCLILIICLVLTLINISNVPKLYNQLTGKTGYMYVTPTEVSYLTFSDNQTMATIENISYTAGGNEKIPVQRTTSFSTAIKSRLNIISLGFLIHSLSQRVTAQSLVVFWEYPIRIPLHHRMTLRMR